MLKPEEYRTLDTFRCIIAVVANNTQFLHIAPEGMTNPKADSVAEIFKIDRCQARWHGARTTPEECSHE